jgi:prolyl oligopeptidase
MYRDVRVEDDYQWLENADDPAVRAWSDTENALARQWLDAAPNRQAIHDRVAKLMGESTPSWNALAIRGGTIFAYERRPPKQHAFIVVRKSLDDAPGGANERTLLDPDAIDPSGATAIDFFVPSHDGKLVAVSLSRGGSEAGDVHVYEVATGKERAGDVVTRVNSGTAGGSLAWKGDGSGFYYTHNPRDGERPKEDLAFYQQVWFHKLGTPTDKDTYAVGKDAPRIAEWELGASLDGKTITARARWGDGGEGEEWVLPPGGKWTQVATHTDHVRSMSAGDDGFLYLLSTDGAPRRKVLRTKASAPDLAHAEVVVPEGEVVVEDVVPTKSRLVLVEQLGGVESARAVPSNGKGAATKLEVPPVGSILGVARLGGDDVAIQVVTFTTPPAWYRASTTTGAMTKTSLASTSSADFSGAEVVRETCTSNDGTAVPITIVRPKGAKLDGSNPTVLYGYGAYGINMTPWFSATNLAWLEQGGVWALAHIRGGGEMGEAWHLSANLTHKQNTFDDLYGCAQHLVDAKYTRPEKLAIEGGSAGGLLMGAEITQHPEAFKAVVTHVGIYDALRVERDANGAFNVTEFGTVTDPDQFAAMYAYSPYHHVKDGTAYPACLFLTGANDPRVLPYHSRKMVARLQEASTSDAPILLRTSANTGHGMGSPLSERIEQQTDVYAFLFTELGVAYAAR